MNDKTILRTADVIIPIPVDDPYTYLVSEELDPVIQPGMQVIVPFGERYHVGIVLACHEHAEPPQRALKSIYDIVYGEPFIGPDLQKLLEWIADYYICHLGEAFRLVNPVLNLKHKEIEVRRLPGVHAAGLSPALLAFWELVPEKDWISVSVIARQLEKKNLLYRVSRLKQLGLAESRYVPPAAKKIYKTVDTFLLKPEAGWPEKARGKYSTGSDQRYQRARDLILHLQSKGEQTRKAIHESGFSPELVRRLEKESVLARGEERVYREQQIPFGESAPATPQPLTSLQKAFIAEVRPFIDDHPAYRTFLLHGITGSGKTRIYIELVGMVLARGLQAIVLIPEIVLTPQTMARFQRKFGDKVAMIHSRISPGEKLEVLHKAREGLVSIVVGPRSAIFTPFKQLGIIIIDEEHEGSYKQNDAMPRYNGRDVALYRAALNKIPIVLGSATPSFESLHNALSGRYAYYHLSERVNKRNLPRAQIIDARIEGRKLQAPLIFSEILSLKMEARLICREQAMLLQNRRGYSPYILCSECNYVMPCPNCDIMLTYHTIGKQLRCHYCGHTEPAPDACPQCKGLDILYKGIGTQKIEETAIQLFPHARFIRMDQDTTRRKDDYARILETFRGRKADFLIGTKMIAKGLDFEAVTLIGIINADQGLHFPDFRAPEKTFQMLVQAAGRAGRGAHSGEVIIQTYDPEHYIFKYVLAHDYLGFYHREIESRKLLKYPPFSRLCLVRVVAASEQHVFHYAGEIARYLRQNNPDHLFSVLGPAPSPLVRIDNQYRYQVLIKQERGKDPSMQYVRRLLREGIYKNKEVKKWPVTIQIDVDPVDIL